MGIEPIKPEHKKILDKIRELFVKAGGEPYYRPEDWGLNEFGKCGNGIEIHFDYGTPQEMYTPDGYYVILGSNRSGDSKKFWELFIQEFKTTIVVPKRDDSRTSEIDFQTCYSGPIVRIR